MTKEKIYTLIGADGIPYESIIKGTMGGYKRGKVYGKLDCRAALRAITKGGYEKNRVFFADEQTAIRAGYRPCAVCMPVEYAVWKKAKAEDKL